ncbi:hypothetical protein Asulf_01327 [Archaeoglobus sulfaticallidus PM70-1]|uniref:Uncharacterized protein n=1 Tax=Archaeoglobus sulfaticallidus PM70-1 TaxID=387631 RepID=N0BE71_9EURY|nr:hypothetical protein [Archaeoglobus sulfaticallidus]AGK61318.1 hypothetical protein Asulf_01327 [Archaeoglobus sulfaticallidus PM70-1]
MAKKTYEDIMEKLRKKLEKIPKKIQELDESIHEEYYEILNDFLELEKIEQPTVNEVESQLRIKERLDNLEGKINGI